MGISEASPLAITGFITIFLGFLVLLSGILMAKRKDYSKHKNLMLSAAFINSVFIMLYVVRFLTGDETHFQGPSVIRNFVYYPILIVHILFALISIYLIFNHLKATYSHVQWQEKNPYFGKDYRNIHRRYGRITFFFWFTSYIGGITVFIMLYILF